MRSRMPASSSSHIARSAGVESTVATPRAVRRRVRVVGADDALELAQHARRVVLAGADDRERADALAVQREALRDSWSRRRSRGRRRGRAGPPARPRRCRRRSPGRPCRGRARGRARPAARRPAATARASGRSRSGCGSRRAGRRSCRAPRRSSAARIAGEVDVLAWRVVVRVGRDLEAGAFEQGAVVLPARLADQDARRGRRRCSRSAPTFSPPVPPTAWTVAIRPSRARRVSAPNTSAWVAAS